MPEVPDDATRHRIQAAKAGDRQAQDHLFRAQEESLRVFLGSQVGAALGARTDVEDLLQETFLRACRSFGSFHGKSERELRGWLSTIASHVVTDRARELRAQKADVRREVSLSMLGENESQPGVARIALESPTSSPSRILRREERWERLSSAISALSPYHREVIRLARIEGLPMKEVAIRMGRSEKAASMLLVRAQRELRSIFGETESLSLPRPPAEEAT